jgi:hypothetical protein
MFAGLMLTGCAWFKHEEAGPAGGQTVAKNSGANANATNKWPIVTPDPSQAGSVLQVNVSARFAVLNFPVGSMPPVGQRLYVYRAGLKVGELKVTGPQRDDNTVADIVNGEAQAGDVIRTQ